jgi:hypothetical protein
MRKPRKFNTNNNWYLEGPRKGIDPALFQSHRELAARLRTGHILRDLGLDGRYRQLLVDSLQFDHEPHAGTVELGFVDGGHSLAHVRNDTEKMAVMAAPRGLVFWHDYGGSGDFGMRPVTWKISKTIPIFAIPGTNLAWAAMPDLDRICPSTPAESLGRQGSERLSPARPLRVGG